MSEVSWEAGRSPDEAPSGDQRSKSPDQDESVEGDGANSPNQTRSHASSDVEKDVPRHRQLYVGNIPPDATVPQIQKLFEEFEPIARVDLKSGFAFVFLEDKEQAERAIRLLNGTKKEELFGFRTLKVEYAKDASLVKQKEEERKRRAEQNPTESLFVTNFPSYFRERDLERIFDQFGKVVRVEIIRSYAFVTFSTIKDASKAYEKMHHFTLDDGRELHVEYVTANRMGRRQPRERESRFGYRRRSPRRYSSVSPSRRRIVRSRSSSLERQYKRRRLVGYRMSSERRYHIGKNGSDRSSPLRERSPSYPVRERLRNARRSPVRSVQRREPSDRDERTLRRRETTEGNRELPSERRSTLYSHVRASPGRPRTRVESPFSRRDNDGREPERRRSISPRDPEYPRRREKISVPEGSRREGFREADKTSLTNHNGDREARTSPDDYYDRRHSFRHSRAYEERDFQRRDRLSTENRHARERRSVEGRIR